MAEPILPNLQEPAVPPRRSRLRTLTGLLLLGAMVGGVWAFGYWEPRLLPVRTIEVQGEVHNHSSTLLQETLAKRLHGGFLTADLRDLKSAAEELAWVGGVSIRRVWPDRLQVRVLEHRPVARWKGDGLVTADGVIFRPRGGVVPAGLPFLEGDEQRARELVERYLKWRDALMLAGHLIDTLSVDARGAWRVELVSNTQLELGAADVEQRLTRFIGAAPQLDAAGKADRVDLRYSNGFAVRWARSSSPSPETAPAPTLSKKQMTTPKKGSAVNKVTGRKSAAKPSQRSATAKPPPTQKQQSASNKTQKPATPPNGTSGAPRAPVKQQAPTKQQAPAQRPRAAPAGLPARALTQAVPARP